jgi:uncharacterized membrane protein YwaF
MNELFGTKHIILMIISILSIIGFYFLSRKWKFSTICKTLLGIAIICEIVKTLTYIVINEDKYGGILPKSDLPFQLCSIQLIFIAIVTFSKNEKMKRVLLSFMMPSCLFGGIAAILIATSSSLNVWVITIQYFFYHTCLSTFAIHLFTSKEYKWNVKDYLNSLTFILCLFFFAIYINSMLYDGSQSVNFMYVVNPPQKGLPYLNKDSGWIIYMLRYSILVLMCITICYIKPIIVAIKEKVKGNKNKD